MSVDPPRQNPGAGRTDIGCPGSDHVERPFGRAFAAAPEKILRRLRTTCPVAPVLLANDQPAWFLTRAGDVRRAFTDPRLPVQGPPRPVHAPGQRALDISLMNYDQPHLGRVRRLAMPLLTARRMTQYRQLITSIARDIVTDLSGRTELDLLADFAHPFSFRSIVAVMGLDRAAAAELFPIVSAIFQPAEHSAEEIERCIDQLDEFLTAEVKRRLVEPGPGVISGIVSAWDSGSAVRLPEVISLCAMILLAGYDTTAQMICMSVATILSEPRLRRRLEAGPESTPELVEELLRRHTPGPSGTPRTAVTDLEIGGTRIPAGSKVILSIAGANLDPANQGPSSRHITFGLGPHYCLGSSLARLEMEVALTEIMRHFPSLRLARDIQELSWHGNHVYRGLRDLVVRM